MVATLSEVLVLAFLGSLVGDALLLARKVANHSCAGWKG